MRKKSICPFSAIFFREVVRKPGNLCFYSRQESFLQTSVNNILAYFYSHSISFHDFSVAEDSFQFSRQIYRSIQFDSFLKNSTMGVKIIKKPLILKTRFFCRKTTCSKLNLRRWQMYDERFSTAI